MGKRKTTGKKSERSFSPSDYHYRLMEHTTPALSYHGGDFPTWRRRLRHKLAQLIGWLPTPGDEAPRFEVEASRDKTDYVQRRIVYSSEPFADVPAYLLLPKRREGPLPVMICLQGHSPGVHISIGEPRDKNDRELIAGDRDYAVQAVRRGFAAFAIEQRAFGERRELRQEQRAQHGCHDAAMHSLMLGRTLLGERVGDVIRAIDLLSDLAPEEGLDMSRLACMGNSGGGTITFFSALCDDRIRLAVPSCYFCTYSDSIMRIYHCADNYIPRLLLYAESYDLAGLVAPRHMLVVAGEKDGIFPIHGVRKAFRKAKSIFRAAGTPGRIRLFVGKEGHRFYAASWKHILAWANGTWR